MGRGRPEADLGPVSDRSRSPAAGESKPRTVASRFEADGEKTAWSEETQQAIDHGFDTASFHAIQGGDLTADCKQSICKLEWLMPDPSGLPSEDLDTMLSMARLELVGLASRKANLTGRIDAEISLDSGPPRLAVYIERKDPE